MGAEGRRSVAVAITGARGAIYAARTLAALRDRMLRLAAQKADGAFTNFLPLSNVAQVVRAVHPHGVDEQVTPPALPN